MIKKIAIIGKGTAGALTAAHLNRWLGPQWEIEWYYDPNINPEGVGEGSTLELPRNLFKNLNFQHSDLKKLDGTLKQGTYKENWTKDEENREFYHNFFSDTVSYHFNAVKLQQYISSELYGKINIIGKNITAEKIDADFIIDATSTPKDLEAEHQIQSNIPVNSAYINQCYWDYPKIGHTLAIARPYGWVFGIPLQNRLSVGYMFNNNFNNLKDIKEDITYIYHKFQVEPSEIETNFSFDSYRKINNYTDRIAYSGNASFFHEPLEATSVSMIDTINRGVIDIARDGVNPEEMNQVYHNKLDELNLIIMLHYAAGGRWDTPFWDYAEKQGIESIESVKDNDKFRQHFLQGIKLLDPSSSNLKDPDYPSLVPNYNVDWGTWTPLSMGLHINKFNLFKYFS